MNRPLLMALAGVLAVSTAIALNYYAAPDDEPAEPTAPRATKSEQKPTADKQSKPSQKPEEPKATGPVVPSFDVVRVNPKGDTVMAGRAEPGSTVIVVDDDKVIGEVKADRRGEWVFVPDKPLDPGSRRLSLQMKRPDLPDVKSDSEVVLVVPERQKDIAGRPTDKETQALALKVPRERPGPSTVLQKPSPYKSGDLSVDTVDYDDQGHLSIAGHAPAGAKLQVYLSNSFIGRTEASGKGLWRLTVDKTIEEGLYTLRVDHVDSKGKVLARVAFPFTRSKMLTSMKPGSFVIVQPGNSLWRIARRSYGTGFQYTVIYDANKDQIKDPDLIYPGQIFSLPPSN